MADNENLLTTPDTPGSIDTIGIPVITMELNPSSVIPNAVDPTLTNVGEAAEAAATGARFETVEDTVSGISYDIYGTDSTDPECLRIEQRLEAVEETMVTTSDIDTTLATSGKAADAKATGDAIGALNGSTLKYAGSGDDSIKDVVDELDGRVETLEGKTANEILYVTGGNTIKQKVDAVDAAQPFAVSFAAGSATRDTVEDERITANHIVASLTVQHPADISWTTISGKVTVECASGIPAMTLVLCLPPAGGS